MATIGSLVIKVGTDISGLEQGLQTAQGRLRGFGTNLRNVGTGLTLGMTAPIVGIAAAAVSSTASFEQSMNLMQVASGASEAQMAALQAQALTLGAETSFSAGEAAAAMLELSKAGMSAEQTGAAIEGVMDLAAAGNLGLADAATITSNAINAFGLEAGSAADVANVFAAAANASSADVGDLAAGFQMAGAVFAANGQDVDALAASLAILSNNGIAGSDAGTSLKTMMMRLAAPTAEAAGVMDALGLNIYDATGEMLPFGEAIAQIEQATAGMGDEQRNAALQTIFGADAIRAATILAAEGAGSFEEMLAAVTAEGAAAEMADARMKGLGGAIEYFKGAVDSALIGAALPLSETLAGMIRGAADLISSFGKLSPRVQRFAAVLIGVAAVGGPLLMVLGAMATGLALLLSPVGLIVAGLVLLGVALATNWDLVVAFGQGVMALGRYLQTAAGGGGAMNEWLTRLPGWAQPAAQALGGVADAAHDLATGEKTWGEMGAALVAEMQRLPSKIQGWAAAVDWAGLVASGGDVGTKIQEKITGWVADVDWAAAVTGAGDWLGGLKQSVADALGRVDWAGGAQSLGDSVNAWTETAKTHLETALTAAHDALAAGAQGASTVMDEAVTLLTTTDWSAVAQDAVGKLQTMRDTVNGWRDEALTAATSWVDGVNWGALSLNFSGFVNRLATGIQGIDFGQIDFAGWIRSALLGPLSTAFAIVKWVVGSEKFEGFKASVLAAVSEIRWGEVFASIGNLSAAVFDSVVEAANGVITDLIAEITNVDWSTLSIDFAGMLSAIGTKIGEIDWSEIGVTIGTKLRALFVGEGGEGGLAGLATAIYDAVVAIEWATVFASAGELLGNLKTAIKDLVGSAIASLFGATLNGDGSWTAPEWVTRLLDWVMPEAPDWLTRFLDWNLPDAIQWMVDFLGWVLPDPPQWLTDFIEWVVPGAPDWLNDLMDWQPKMPGWVGRLLDWMGGGGNDDATPPASESNTQSGGWSGEGDRSSGDRSGPGGGFGSNSAGAWGMRGGDVWAGMGAELTGGAAGAGTTNIYVTVNEKLDWEQLNWRLSDLKNRRRTGR